MRRDPERYPTPRDEEQRRVGVRFALLLFVFALAVVCLFGILGSAGTVPLGQ